MSICILVVDDDELTRIMMEDFLNYLGFKVFLAEDTTEAIKRFVTEEKMAVECGKNNPIQLVITDNCMPHDGDGSRLLQWVKKRSPGIPVILMSGNQFNADHVVHQQGFAEIVTKANPSRSGLADLVRRHMYG